MTAISNMPGHALPVVGKSGRTLEYPSPLLEGISKDVQEEEYAINTESSRRIVDIEGAKRSLCMYSYKYF